MYIGKPSQIAVKWANGSWTYYRAHKTRSVLSIADYFRKIPHFRFLIIYEWVAKKCSSASPNDPSARGQQLYYIDKYRISNNPK